MKFVVTSNYQYWWPIKVRIPHEDPRKAGQAQEFQFKAQFRSMSLHDATALQAEIDALPAEERADRQNDALKQVLIGWDSDLLGEDGAAFEFSPDNLGLLLTNVWALQALYFAWGASLTTGAARKGN